MKKPPTFCFVIVLITFAFGMPADLLAQAKKKTVRKSPAAAKKRPSAGIGTAAPMAVFSLEESPRLVPDPPKHLWLEPCAKETPEQIAEVENARDADQQAGILTNRLTSKDEWIRGCAIYRLKSFGKFASPALPLLFKLLRDDDTDGIYYHVFFAIYSIPPGKAYSYRDWLKMAEDTDVYRRLYGVWALGYYTPNWESDELKDAVKLLIAATKDEDSMVKRLAIQSIIRLGPYARKAVPVLVEILQKKDGYLLQTVEALDRMGQHAFPAVPLLFDMLYKPEAYEKDENRRYALNQAVAESLAHMGDGILPVLEREFNKNPYLMLTVASFVTGRDISGTIIRGLKYKDKGVREKAAGISIENYETAIKVFPFLIKTAGDPVPEVRKQAIQTIGYMNAWKNKPPEFDAQLKTTGLNTAIKLTKDLNSDVSCYAASAISEFGIDGEKAIPALVSLIKRDPQKKNYCAERALFRLGDKGRIFLSPERLKQIEEGEKDLRIRLDRSEGVKPIQPKVEQKTPKIPDNF